MFDTSDPRVASAFSSASSMAAAMAADSVRGACVTWKWNRVVIGPARIFESSSGRTAVSDSSSSSSSRDDARETCGTSARRASRYGVKSRSVSRTPSAPSPSKPTSLTSTVACRTIGASMKSAFSRSVRVALCLRNTSLWVSLRDA